MLRKDFDLQITAGGDGKGLKLYDPGYLNTAPVRSAVSYIDGDKGILRYRGYPIEELAEKSTYLEVAYLLCKRLGFVHPFELSHGKGKHFFVEVKATRSNPTL